jgi:hypothetical protein
VVSHDVGSPLAVGAPVAVRVSADGAAVIPS